MYEPTYLGEIELSEETLAHYGVKGMRWRHRKNQSSSVGNKRIRGKRYLSTITTPNGGKLTVVNRRAANGQEVGTALSGKRLSQISNRPTARRRRITGSVNTSEGYQWRRGKVGGGPVGSRSSVTRSPGLGYSQVTGGNGSVGLTLSGGYSQALRPTKGEKQRKKKKKG